MSLTRFLKLRARTRYWKRRALKSERALITTQAWLEAERYRSMEREDSFVSAVLREGRGLYGVPPRTGPAMPIKPVAPRETSQPAYSNPTGLGGADLMEFQVYHLPDALRAGVSAQKALQDFQEIIASRRSPLNDDQNFS